MSNRSHLSEGELVAITDKIIKTESPIGEWYSEYGGCIDLSRELQKALAENGVVTDRRVGRGHISLRYHTQECNDPVYIDSSYLQFFGDGVKRGMPKVLVGTASSIRDLFTKHIQAGIRSSIEGVQDIDRFIEDHYTNTKPYTD